MGRLKWVGVASSETLLTFLFNFSKKEFLSINLNQCENLWWTIFSCKIALYLWNNQITAIQRENNHLQEAGLDRTNILIATGWIIFTPKYFPLQIIRKSSCHLEFMWKLEIHCHEEDLSFLLKQHWLQVLQFWVL